MEHNRPKVGLGVYILNEKGEVLLLQRKGAHGSGTWCPPGGHLEFGESFEECAKREAKEESGLEICEVMLLGVLNDIMLDEAKHYVTLNMSAKLCDDTAPRIMEPDKSDAIDWFPLNQLPTPLFLPVQNFFDRNPECLCRSGKLFKQCHGK